MLIPLRFALQEEIHRSASTLQPTFEVNNIDRLAMVQRSSGKPLALAFVRMFFDP